MRRARANSSGRKAGSRWFLSFFVLVIACSQAEEAPEASAPLREYRKAKAAYEAQPQSHEATWQFGRACFDVRETGTSKSRRAEIAQEGIAACRHGLASMSNSAPLRYYLGLNLGALAETRGLSALKLVNQMEQELLGAVALDERFNFAGPDRVLGMLYRDAPSFISVGSRSKARQRLVRAVELAPLYPDNRFELIQAYLGWNDRTAARKELKALQASWDTARAELAGPRWEDAWRDWGDQRTKLEKKLEEPSKLQTPRH